jgi:hypothetical protein
MHAGSSNASFEANHSDAMIEKMLAKRNRAFVIGPKSVAIAILLGRSYDRR